MGLTKQEQKITITKIADEKAWNVYISDPRYKRKLDKLGVTPYKVEKMDNEEVGWFYKLDEKMICIRQKPKKRNYTEEQLKAISERFKNIRK